MCRDKKILCYDSGDGLFFAFRPDSWPQCYSGKYHISFDNLYYQTNTLDFTEILGSQELT